MAILDGLEAEEWLPPNYNITPSRRIPAVLDSSPHRLQWIEWGFPSTYPGRPPLINARGETVHRLPTFREAFRQRRCIVFADGFYEWRRDKSLPRPQPYYFHRAEGGAIILAALWQPGETTTGLIVTTEANSLMHPIHDRMPVILSPECSRLWLNRETHPDTLRALLQPCPSDQMACHPVSDRVNRAASEGEELIKPVRIHEQPGLF